MRVDVDGSGDGLQVKGSARIFGGQPVPGQWLIAPDGKRLLVFVPQGGAESMSLNLVTDWRQLPDSRREK